MLNVFWFVDVELIFFSTNRKCNYGCPVIQCVRARDAGDAAASSSKIFLSKID